ncbi:hypothetical protein C463_16916 [Halorubrum californiense DSM 19288]|uniref:Uncharacterized protein n=1 Tax=Halorubrum californiense DSM 19288 TaxID=1227465 RepID=M0DY77_9EURY|nr:MULTISPECIES: hypothetical protein [Halorubrum]ELZ39677.1 hypothetical protein C463_16916 [Halorubrum californiense DSM 19288]TKX67739.1 hypothetical protein EXE40_14405 [Halorubrum sp. GN11GM_10-3_MGM]
MDECHVCRAAATAECAACGRPVCESHSAVADHDCDPHESASRKTDRTSVRIENSNETNVRIDNSQIGSVRVNGSGPTDDDAAGDSAAGDSAADVDRLSELVDLKARMDADSPDESGDSGPSTALVKALEQASELKAAASDPSTEREDLTPRIDRLVDLIDRIDDVSGQALRNVADVEAALSDTRTSRLAEDERRRLRNAVEELEDELHVAV